MSQRHALKWGALDFAPTAPAAAGYLIESVADGTAFGNPEARVESVRSLLTDGSLAILEGWDNREVTIRLRLSSPVAIAGPALAAAESALMAELLATSKSPLVYTPPATDAATCVFDVVGATLERDYADDFDLEEEQREYRYYSLTLTCLPFARTVNKVVIPAFPPGPPVPTTVTIDDCSSIAGWSTPDTGPTLVESGQAVRAVAPDGISDVVTLTRTGAVAMGTTPYLVLDMTGEMSTDGLTWNPTALGSVPSMSVVFNGNTVALPLGRSENKWYFRPPASFNTMRVEFSGTVTTIAYRITVRDVARTDSAPVGYGHQQARTAVVKGSAPTQAAIRLFDQTPDQLGSDILVHTSRNTAWQPPLRPYRVSSAAVTADATLVSGSRNTLGSAMVFRFPASRITEGTYSLLARMSISATGALAWSARTVSSLGGSTVGSSIVLSGSVNAPSTGGAYRVLNLAALPLPVVKSEATQMIELTLTGTANMTVDEAWLFGLHDGALTWLQDSDSLSWIETRSPELGASRPSVYGGTGSKGSNSICVDWKCQSFGTHRFDPGLIQIFTVTTASLVAQSEIDLYPRGHSHVRDEWAA